MSFPLPHHNIQYTVFSVHIKCIHQFFLQYVCYVVRLSFPSVSFVVHKIFHFGKHWEISQLEIFSTPFSLCLAISHFVYFSYYIVTCFTHLVFTRVCVFRLNKSFYQYSFTKIHFLLCFTSV